MSVSNVTPVAASTLSYADEFSFEVTAGYTSLQVKVTVMGGGLEAAYDDGVGAGYTVTIDDLGATHRFTVKRDSGWSISPTTVNVVEDGAVTTWTYEVFPTASYPEGMQPYNGIGADVSNLVTSWNSRTGNVVPVASDYDASQVDNDSGVAGATVKDALDQLDTDIAAIPAAPVDSVFGRTGAVVAVAGDYDDTEVAHDAVIGTPTNSKVADVLQTHGTPGIVNGTGTITDNLDGTVAITGGTGYIRATNSDTAALLSFDISAVPSQALTDADLNYIYIEYNAGTPQYVVTLTPRTDLNSNLYMGSVHRQGLDLHITNHTYSTGNIGRKLTKRFNDTDGLTRASGSILSETGTRNIAVTTGTWWHGLDEVTIQAFNTSSPDYFHYFYKDGVGGWTLVEPSYQIDNLQYDDGSGTLATLSANRYGAHWVYVGVDDHLYVLYGEGDYTSSQWGDAPAPAALPPHMQEQHAGLIGRIVIQKSASTFTDVSSAFEVKFVSAGVADHGELAGLTDDDHTQYVLADGTRNQVEVLLDEETTKTGTPSATQAIFWADDHANGQRLRWSRGRYPRQLLLQHGARVLVRCHRAADQLLVVHVQQRERSPLDEPGGSRASHQGERGTHQPSRCGQRNLLGQERRTSYPAVHRGRRRSAPARLRRGRYKGALKLDRRPHRYLRRHHGQARAGSLRREGDYSRNHPRPRKPSLRRKGTSLRPYRHCKLGIHLGQE
jgi:hypothetical protein